MSKKQKKKNTTFKRIIAPIFLCLIIQAGLVYAFIAVMPNVEPIEYADLEEITIVVEKAEYISKGFNDYTHFRVYADGVYYRFRSRAFGEDGPAKLKKKIQPGDVLTLFCEKENSYKLIIGAYSDTETYRSVGALNKSAKMAFIPCIFLCVLLESIFLFLSGLYFSSKFKIMFSKKAKKRKAR